jgi:hypothetical protein
MEEVIVISAKRIMIMSMLQIAMISLLRCDTHTGPTKPLEDFIIREWGIAQMKLIEEGWADEFQITRVLPEQFDFRPRAGTFPCGDAYEANGCFSPPNNIIYNLDTPTVIRHEAGHAILYKLGDDRWKCYEHSEACITS